MPAVKVCGDSFAQLRQAVGRCVTMRAIPQRLDPCLDDMLRRAKVGLADAKVYDVTPFSSKGLRAGQYLEGGLGAESMDGLSELQF